MHIQILGAHNIESQDYRCVSLLIDDVLALDAGSLSSGLSLAAQQKLKAVLLTHQHYDHVRDIPALGMNYLLHENVLEVYATQPVYEALIAHLLNDTLYPNFLERPAEKPSIRFRMLEEGKGEAVAGYTVLPVPVHHSVPTTGFQVTAADGKKVFYTSDTGPGLVLHLKDWGQVSPDLLIIEVTAPNRYTDFARVSGHLSPELLHAELDGFRQIKGYLPRVVTVHMNPRDENIIEGEIARVAQALGADIRLGYEGMRLEL